ncbi:MAG: PDZ domain-containing protein [Planctomycetota bacterium]|nr:PDZ domain-containing protein [Planctomycetota bacterium]
MMAFHLLTRKMLPGCLVFCMVLSLGEPPLAEAVQTERGRGEQDSPWAGGKVESGWFRIPTENVLSGFQIGRFSIGANRFQVQAPQGNSEPRGPRQIILKLKKVDGSGRTVSIGSFARDSWIETSSGRVHLLATPLKQPRKSGESRYWIGVRCSQTDSSAEDRVGGLRVDDVLPRSAAEVAGLQVLDRMVRWNTTPLGSPGDLAAVLQENGNRPAMVQIIRGGEERMLRMVPGIRGEWSGEVKTVMAPASRWEISSERIGQIRELLAQQDPGRQHRVRLILVGPGVNFGKEKLELQINPQLQKSKAHLYRLLEEIAQQQVGGMVNQAELSRGRGSLPFEPHEIWESMEFGVRGKSFTLAKLSPRLIQPAAAAERKSESTEDWVRKTADDLKQTGFTKGEIVFPNPILRSEPGLWSEYQWLQRENERVQKENEVLKQQIRQLKGSMPQRGLDQRN